MPERRYRGESWESMTARTDLEAAIERREAERAEAERAERARAARAARPVATPEPPRPVAPAPTPEPPRPRRTWRDLAPEELNRYALAESRQP